jgi:hypothetical protein
VIQLDIPELGIAGPALVISISPAPPIEPGNGHVITGKFRHVAPEILYLYVEGLEKPIGCTPRHPFWSVTRNDYVPAEDLREGELLRTSSGSTAAVQRHELCHEPTPVYNIEVRGVNAYHVSPLGLLVHNASERTTGPKRGWISTQTWDTSSNSAILRKNLGLTAGMTDEAHHIVLGTHRRAQKARDLLDYYQIDVNDAANGVPLAPSKHHGKGLHSYRGIDLVTQRLEDAIDGIEEWDIGRQTLIDELDVIRTLIRNGKLFK